MPELLDTALERLYSQLRGSDPAGRKKALFELLKRKDQGCVPILQEIAFRDEDVEMRYLAGKAMNFLVAGDRPAPATEGEESLSLDKAREALRSPDAEVRLRAVQVIARAQNTDYLGVIRDQAQCETDPLVRSALPLALAILGTGGEIDLIVQRFLHDPNARVRANAIEALGRIGDKRAHPYIIGFLQDRDHRVRANTVTALGKLGKGNLILLLKDMLIQPQVWMRDSAAFALQLIKTPEAVPLLEMAIRDPYEGVRIKAKKALAALAARGIAKAQTILEAHADVKEEESLEDFLRLGEQLESKDAVFLEEQRAAELLQPKDTYRLDALDRDKRVKEILRVVQNEDTAMAPKLLELLKKETESHVRATLVSALGRLHYGPALTTFWQCLTDKDHRVRANAVDACSRFKDDETYGKLIPMLRDPNNRVLANLVLALDTYPHVDVLPYLEKLATHGKREFRGSAFHVISQLRSFNTLPMLERLIADQDPILRQKSVDLLKELAAEEGNYAARSLLKAHRLG